MLNRLIDTTLVILGVATLVFLLIHAIPGDPVDVMLGESVTLADREQLRQQMGLDQPLWLQLKDYYMGLASLDLGNSIHQKTPVFTLLLERVPATLQLTISAFFLALIIALPMGIWAAAKHNRWQDRGATLFSLLGLSIPNFWLGPLLIIFFSLYLGWFPISGIGGWEAFVLPAFTLGFSMSAISMRMVRSSVLETKSKHFVHTARAKGLSQTKTLWRHVLPNSLLPVVTLLGLQLGALLAGSVITEMIFSWPGLGHLLIESIQRRDYPVVQGCILVISVFYVLVNMLTDWLYTLIDPRLRR